MAVVVDSSVWIDYLNDVGTRKTERLDGLLESEEIVVGDLILCEVLQGLRTESEAFRVAAFLQGFELASMASPDLAVRAAANFRALRRNGITIRKTIDLIIGTFCIERGHALLHDDRDYVPMERHLGLTAL